MAPLPDIHGFKWVQFSPNQWVTTCHYIVHYGMAFLSGRREECVIMAGGNIFAGALF